jgi:protein-tyrosine phosphatase
LAVMTFSSPYSPSDLDKINEVLPYLFIGSYGAAENLAYLREQRITHAICLLKQQPESMVALSNLCLPMSDYGDSDLSLLLAAALPFIESARASGGRVLIFCALGVNRSAALVAGYLRIALRCSPEEALSRVVASRPFISLHGGYLFQLEQLSISA